MQMKPAANAAGFFYVGAKTPSLLERLSADIKKDPEGGFICMRQALGNAKRHWITGAAPRGGGNPGRATFGYSFILKLSFDLTELRCWK
jgi:hypothetical protein